jgi:hypothetical protein
VLSGAGERQTGEPAALIGMEDMGMPYVSRGPPGVPPHKSRGQRIGEAPRQHLPAAPVHGGKQVHHAALHRNAGDVRAHT